MKFWTILTLISFASICSISNGQQSVREAWDQMTSLPEDEAYELGSLYEAFLTNHSAWEKGDVLIKVVTVFDSTRLEYPNEGDLVMETTEYYRFRFDFLKDRFLCAYVVDQEIPLLVHPSIDEGKIVKKQRGIQGFVKNKEVVQMRKFPQKTFQPRTKFSIDELMQHFLIPELRTIGIVAFGSNSNYSHLEKVIARLSSGEGIVRANQLSKNTVRIVRRTGIPGNDDNVFVSTIEFDTDKFVPKSNKIEVEVVKDGVKKLNKNSNEQFGWHEIDGVMVPASVVKDSITAKMIGKHRFIVEKSADATILWKSLNQDIPDSDFSESNLDKLDSIIKLTDEAAFKKELEN